MLREGENQNHEEAEEMRERVDELGKSDNKYEGEDSIYDLAKDEDKYREEKNKSFATRRLTKKDKKEIIDEVANDFSTKEVEKIEKQKEMNKVVMTDPLTGLKNRRAYEDRVPELLTLERRQNTDCSMLVIDFDHFKMVNEEFGHTAGDEALKEIAKLLKKTVRLSDSVYRYGGEEFVIFLPGTISSRAKAVADKLRAKIEKAKIKIAEDKTISKTISIGYAGTDQLEEWDKYDPKKADKFLKRMFGAADLAVRVSKATGRNKVTGYNLDLENLKDKK